MGVRGILLYYSTLWRSDMKQTVVIGNKTYNLSISFSESANETLAAKLLRIMKNENPSDFSQKNNAQEENNDANN